MDLKEIKKKLAAEVRGRRAVMDITQEEFHKRSGVALGIIKKIEKANANPRLDTIVKLAKALNVEIEDLLCCDGTHKIKREEGR